MQRRGWQAAAAAISVVAGAAVGLIINLLTERPGLGLVVGLGGAVLVGVVAQVWLTIAGSSEPGTTTAAGPASVAVTGTSTGEITTQADEVADPPAAPGSLPGGVTASGAGSVAIGGDSSAPIRTRASGTGRTPPAPDETGRTRPGPDEMDAASS